MKDENKQFAAALEKRTLDFAINVVKLSSTLPKLAEAQIIRNQLIKAASSIGANYREANRSESRADFRHKIAICAKEASETVYWLELLKGAKLSTSQHLNPLLDECSQLLALFTAIKKSSSKQ